MAGQGSNHTADQTAYFRDLAAEIERALESSAQLKPSLMEQLVDLPSEVFDTIVGNLTMYKQADLARSSAVLYNRVRPVMDGFVWTTAPLPLPEMMGTGQLKLLMQFKYVKQAEAAAAGTGHVACPWCCVVHDPLRSLERINSGYACTWQGHPGFNYGTMGQLLYGLDNRPRRWHPLVVYAFSIWSQRGRDTTPLVDAADLNLRTEELIAGDNIPTTRSQWKLKWVPGQGLFARWRQSEMVMSADGWTEMEYCCACSEVRKEYDTTLLNARTFDVNATSIQRRSTGANGQTQVTNGGVLTGPYGPLMTGPVAGCTRCSMDFQFAWQEHNTGAEYGVGHWLHFTTWFHIGGKDVDIKAIHDNMKARGGDWHNRFSPGPAGTLPLGVGQVARISDFPDDY